MRYLFLAFVLLWPVGAAADLDAGFRAIERGDHATAMREWLPLAEQGNAVAQNNLGIMYDNGEGVPEDNREALKWYRKAAEQGYAAAQFNLGLMYDYGEGVPEDNREAAKWYRKAAEQGDAAAQFNLGLMYDYGEGVPEDNREAAKWYRKAAEQGDAAAQNNLGLMYDYGEGVPEDNREAAKWYRKAAEQGDAVAQFNLGLMYDYGEGVPEDNREAAKWYRKAAEQGEAAAQFNLGLMYDYSEGVPEDNREAAKWYRKAAEQGDAAAQFNLGLMYDYGEGVPADHIQAYAWFNLAAAQGHVDAAEARSFVEKRMTPSQIAQAQSLSTDLIQGIGGDNAVANSTPVPTTAARPGASQSLVKEAQELLARIGYQPGPADGLLGRRTESAVKAFQSTLEMTPNGIISDELVALLRIVAAAATADGQPILSTGASRRSTGSGFFVSTDGHLVTNRHVIDGCDKVTVTASGAQVDASLLWVDEPNDLALLKAGGGQREPAPLRSSHRAILGEQVTVAGFPLTGLLADDLNVTRGEISALAGLGNDPRVMQITAPVQSGNSGGPLLDKSGQVIGVVVSKLNASEIYKVTGELPQNINFAVKGTLLRGFLDIHGVNYRTGDTEIALSGENVAAKAKRFVVLVGCWK